MKIRTDLDDADASTKRIELKTAEIVIAGQDFAWFSIAAKNTQTIARCCVDGSMDKAVQLRR